MISTEQVLSDFIDAWNAGRRPRVREYVARVPSGAPREELSTLIDLWLQTAPSPTLDEPTRASIRADPAVAAALAAGDERGAWAGLVPRLRERAGLSLDAMAQAVVARFKLSAADQPRAESYLERLERGELQPAGLSRRLLAALADVLGVSAETLVAAAGGQSGPRLASSGGTLFRADEDVNASVLEDIETLSRAALTPAPPERDELDELFFGGTQE